ncbi:bifunctional diguanylate cyclase/phosphodiesterase [Stenotrophomonas sp. 24(2023)]|uniref:bifunctional diguanylate cyclase/phosphodiesterase n=1 Tax=Stenotrophomonas sp. 24(2023) TaxID=3068324 RepID=UPI0027DEB068|nr:bifunctional diguanylate cyclase/phosphodiesterase [Stenotrophomonas sp. 24(2023)]WMJ71510.1 EAL domain-containing protein [Stenotrophomonas sp. 24(2023)]
MPGPGRLTAGWDEARLGRGQRSYPDDGSLPALDPWAGAAAGGGAIPREHWMHDGARFVLAVEGASPAASWWALARLAMELALQRGRQAGQIRALEDAERLQQALFQIADLAGADLEMGQMLHRVHGVLNTLMYAQNCYIVEYDDVRRRIRFLYFADQLDDFVADPERFYEEREMPRSLTFALLRHGRPLSGPSRELLAREHESPDPQRGPESLDWLGVPMLRDGRVSGAIVVQSYEHRGRYGESERALLGFVAQHIQTAMDRRQAQVQLERQVERRTQELQRANSNLQDEVFERRRAEKLQTALFNIAGMAMSAESLEQYYGQVHGVVGSLLDARNFYIALVNAAGDGLEFVYSVDEYTPARAPRRFSDGLTEYVVRNRVPLLASAAKIAALNASGEVRASGVRARCWLGVPLLRDDEAVGVIVVQSYSDAVGFTVHDQRLLTFVAQNIGTGLARQRDQQRLRLAHAELEKRVEERTRELAEVNEKLLGQIAERLRAEQRLTHQAMHDALTGLPNRLHLLDRLDDALLRARSSDGAIFAMLFLDLDRFKLVNDSIGHAAGDRMLVEVAKRIVSMVGPDDVVARLGGDEFAVLLQCPQGLVQALDFGQRLLLALQESMWVAGRELFPSGSLGIALWNPRYRNGEELLRDADAAMYRAKAQGQDRCAIFDEDMREQAMRSLDLEADLRRAINNRDFIPYYQPIVRLVDGVVVGHEALLRWQHERRGVLPPSAFLDLGEESGLIEQVDWLLYEQVIATLARGGHGYVSVNVSPRHFRSVDFTERLFGLVEAFDADPRRLRLEITEVALLDDGPRTLRILQALRERGIQVQLDDFGTGFSALSYLHRFPINTLKIDQSFIAGLHGETQSTRALVQGVISLARTLGIETIGEGIETEAQRNTLQELDCDYGQGYLLGRPGPWSAATA